MTADQLRKLEDDFRASYERADIKRERRNEGVRTALAEGWTHQQISDATGLSRGRISQIARGERAAA